MVEADNQVAKPNTEQQKTEEKRSIAEKLSFGESDVGIELFYSDTATEKQELVEL